MTLEGNPWFVANDSVPLIGLVEDSSGGYGNKLQRLDKEEVRTLSLPTRRVGGGDGPVRKQFLISESGLYKLIMRSDKPQAKAFQDWVTKEVLPSIRKTGSYSLHQRVAAQAGTVSPRQLPLVDAAPLGNLEAIQNPILDRYRQSVS